MSLDIKATVDAQSKTVPKTIAIDFDGTLCENAFPNIGPIKAGAKEAVQLFKRLGYRIVIWTCRTCFFHFDVYGGDPKQPSMERERVIAMVKWLDEHGIEYDEVDDGTRGKVSADFYIDDKAIRFENNWELIAKAIESLTERNGN